MGFNPFSHIITHMSVTTCPYQRELSEIVIIEVVSFAMLVIAIYMTIRYFSIFLMCCVLMGVATKAGLQMITKQDKAKLDSEDSIVGTLEMMRVLYTIIKYLFSQTALNLILFSQIMLTVGAWVTISVYSMIPLFLNVMTITGLAGSLALCFLLLNTFTNARLISNHFIMLKRDQFGGRHYGTWSKSKYYAGRWKSQQPLTIYCGSQFAFSKNAIINYMDVLNSNITNAVLLITADLNSSLYYV